MALYDEVVRGETEQLGPSHTSTLHTKGNKADLLEQLGRHEGAMALYDEVIRGQTEQLGPSHTSTLRTKGNTAGVLVKLGRLAEARALYEEAIRSRTEQLGGEHPDTLNAQYGVVCIEALGQQSDDALRRLEMIKSLGWDDYEWTWQDEDLASLQEGPHVAQFEAICGPKPEGSEGSQGNCREGQ